MDYKFIRLFRICIVSEDFDVGFFEGLFFKYYYVNKVGNIGINLFVY